MKKYIIVLFSILTTAFLFSGCDKNFEEFNRNVDDPEVVPSSQIIGTPIRNIANSLYSTFNGSEIGENWIQHNALNQYNDPDRYRPRVSSMDGMWNTFYAAIADANALQELALVEENQVNQGIALVIKSYAFLLLADLYGDVPFTEAILGPSEGIFAPVYDSQETVYDGVFAMLDEAITLLSSGVGTTDSNYDILYYGDASGWNKFAHSLKFRALMRISAKRDVSSELQSLVNSGMLFSSNADEAKLVYTSSSPNANPIYETVVEQSRAEHSLSATLVDFLIDYNDPRLPVYCQPAEASGTYVGKPNGYAETPLAGFTDTEVSAIGTLYVQPESPAYFMSYTQLLYLMAEAAQKGYISGGDAAAQEYYENAIANSLAENGVADGYDDYISDPRVAYNSAEALEKIGVQMWAALFCQGFEAWTEWRRTKYPVLVPAVEGYLPEIPSRLRYESNEVSVNAVNYNDAVARFGADNLTRKVWWMN
jgi:hypothetical protein